MQNTPSPLAADVGSTSVRCFALIAKSSAACAMPDLKVNDHFLKAYDDYYVAEDPLWRRLGAIDKAATIVDLCRDVPHDSILEIGAGDGSILQRLSELGFGYEVHAAEISRSGIDAIRAKQISTLVDCHLFDGYRLPFADDQFGLAVLSHVVEHVEHPRQLLYEAARVAKHLFVEVPLEDMSRMRRDFVADRVGHINFYSPRTIRWLVQSCGLRVIRQVTTNASRATYVYQSGSRGAINHRIKQLLLAAAPRFATRHFTYHESLICAKAASPSPSLVAREMQSGAARSAASAVS